MPDIQQQIAAVLVAHRPKVVRDTKARPGFIINRDGCAACDWIDHSHPTEEGFAAHVAEVLIAELALKAETSYGVGGVGGLVLDDPGPHAVPIARRHVTDWKRL